MNRPTVVQIAVRRNHASVLSTPRAIGWGRLVTLTAAVVALLVMVAPAQAQPLDPYDLGGAKRPAPELSFGKGDQYKRVHQTALRFILRGQLDRTETFLRQYLDDHPGDPETLWALGMLHTQRGELDTAEAMLRRAIDAGLPEDRLLAGPRSLNQPLADTRLFDEVQKQYAHRPLHGPLLGNLTDSSAEIWLRTAAASDVRVLLADSLGRAHAPAQSLPASDATAAESDFTAVVKISGLQPDTEYRYTLRIDGVDNRSDSMRFRTLPSAVGPAKFAVAFGGGAGYVPEHERMWDTILRYEPTALLLLGDNVYIDDPESPALQQYTYYRRQSRPEWRRLTAQVPVYAIWDDHDFSTNDSWGGPAVDVPFWKRQWVWPIFQQNWANPAYGGGDQHPGCFYRFRIADVDFLMLDCRYYRTDPGVSPRSMLGPAQLAWFKQQLRDCDGTFKIICSSVPWDFRTKGGSLDTWNGYREEREEIFSFIDAESIEGVVLVSADRHRSDAWRIERARGYDFFEFNSSRLTNQHVHPTMEAAGAIFSYNELQSFGFISFDTTLADPVVTYEVVNIDGEKVHGLSVKRSQLQ